MNTKLGVFVLSHRRPELVKSAVDSILSQDYPDYHLIISENSPDDSVCSAIQAYSGDKRVRIVKRQPNLQALEHFNQVLSEAQQYEYAMLFHDDDIMLPGCLSALVKAMNNNPNLSAVSGNAFFIDHAVLSNRLYNPFLRKNRILNSHRQLIMSYLVRSVPFPAYLYRTKHIKNLILDKTIAGKYSDSAFLVGCIKKAPFLWLSQPLIGYRLHSTNDSVDLDLKYIRKLCFFYIKEAPEFFIFICLYYLKLLVKKIFFSYR